MVPREREAASGEETLLPFHTAHEVLHLEQRVIGVGPGLGFAALAAQEHRLALDHHLVDRPHRAEPAVLIDGAENLLLPPVLDPPD